MQVFFIYFTVFIGALILSDILVRRLRDSIERKSFINYRISLIEENVDRQQVYDRMLKERGYSATGSKTLVGALILYFSQSGLKYAPLRSAVQFTGILLGFFVALYFAGYGGVLGILLALICAVATVALVIGYVRSKRIGKFVDQLPEALDVIVRSLSAGHPLPTSIALVAREMPDPIGSEFGLMSDEMTYGTDVDVAVRNMERRIGATELGLLAISLSVQRGVGGNLAEILANLSDMIRKRTMMRAKIKAISVEGRMTSWFMLIFPFFLYSLIRLIRPDYFDPVWNSGYGNYFIAIAAVMMAFGMLILRKLVNFDF